MNEHAAASGSSYGHEMMTLTIDGQEVTVPHGTSVFDAARILGITIPVLCHQQNQTPIGVCRICLCDVGERALQAACVFKAEPGMVVHTDTEPIKAIRKTLYELMLTDHPSPCLRQQQSNDCELETQAAKAGILPPDVRFNKRAVPVMSEDDTSPAIHVDYSACILCGRCIRGCSEIRHNNVIAREGKGYFTTIAFDAKEPMGNSLQAALHETPTVAPSHAPQRFFTAALFSHTAHNTVQCEECHAAALTSTSGNDLLMPNIGICQRCHDGQSRSQGPALSSSHAESGCGLCHEYHETLKAELKTGTQSPMPAAFRIDQLTSR